MKAFHASLYVEDPAKTREMQFPSNHTERNHKSSSKQSSPSFLQEICSLIIHHFMQVRTGEASLTAVNNREERSREGRQKRFN